MIVVGTAANGAVLQTASQAALTGYNVIIPVDGIERRSLRRAIYRVERMVNAPGVSAKSTPTKSDMIKFWRYGNFSCSAHFLPLVPAKAGDRKFMIFWR